MSSHSSLPRIAVHKFTSCSGCQLAFINMGEDLIKLTSLVEIVHFVEAGFMAPNDPVDISFVEGSITTSEGVKQLEAIREKSTYLISVGACATSGGIQALKNSADNDQWMRAVYPRPEYINSLSQSSAIKNFVKVDFELWGCPVEARQMLTVVSHLLLGVMPRESQEKVCQECKRRKTVCRLVTRGEACMGPVTRAGCGALCPSFGAACYACYGPSENVNIESFGKCLIGLGLNPERVRKKFLSIHNAAPEFDRASRLWSENGSKHL